MAAPQKQAFDAMCEKLGARPTQLIRIDIKRSEISYNDIDGNEHEAVKISDDTVDVLNKVIAETKDIPYVDIVLSFDDGITNDLNINGAKVSRAKVGNTPAICITLADGRQEFLSYEGSIITQAFGPQVLGFAFQVKYREAKDVSIEYLLSQEYLPEEVKQEIRDLINNGTIRADATLQDILNSKGSDKDHGSVHDIGVKINRILTVKDSSALSISAQDSHGKAIEANDATLKAVNQAISDAMNAMTKKEVYAAGFSLEMVLSLEYIPDSLRDMITRQIENQDNVLSKDSRVSGVKDANLRSDIIDLIIKHEAYDFSWADFNLRDGISPIKAILDVAFTKNTFFEIPTGFGKTATIFNVVAQINHNLKQHFLDHFTVEQALEKLIGEKQHEKLYERLMEMVRSNEAIKQLNLLRAIAGDKDLTLEVQKALNPFYNRKTIYITHNSLEFNRNANRYNKLNIFFRDQGMRTITLCKNDGKVNPEYRGRDQWTIDSISKTPEQLLKSLQDGSGADVIYMDSDTLMFIQLALTRNADSHSADIALKLWNEIFNNSKLVFDEVDTIFFKNRAQEGLDNRPLTETEIKNIDFVNDFMKEYLERKESQDFINGYYEKARKLDPTMTIEKARTEAERSLLTYVVVIDGKMETLTYEQWDKKHNRRSDIVMVYFNEKVHTAFMEYIETQTHTPARFKGELKNLYESQDEKIIGYRQSLVGRTNCLTQFLGNDVAADPASKLIKPAPQGVLAPQLQLSDPYFAGHTEVVFKQALGEQAYLKDESSVKGIRLSNLSTVTSLAAAMNSAMSHGADIGGFSGTLNAVKDLSELMFNVSVNQSMGTEHSPFDYSSRIDSYYKANDHHRASEAAARYLMEHNVPIGVYSEGATRSDDNSAGVIGIFLENGSVVLAKERDDRWTLRIKIGDSVEVVDISLGDGDINVQNFTTLIRRAERDVSYRAVFLSQLQQLNKEEGTVNLSQQAADTVLSTILQNDRTKLVFYLNAPATRATDIQLTDFIEQLEKSEGSRIEAVAVIDSGTTSWFFEQLAGRIRGYRYYVAGKGEGQFKYEKKIINGKEVEVRIYQKLHVYMVDSRVSGLTEVASVKEDSTQEQIKQIKQKIGAMLQEHFSLVDAQALKDANFNAIADLIDIRGAEFLSRLKMHENEQGRQTLHELITMYQSFLHQNDQLKPEGRQKDSTEALYDRVKGFMEYLREFKDNEGRFKGKLNGRFNQLSKPTQDAINQELENFAAGRMQIHLQNTKESLKAKRQGLAYAPTMSVLVEGINSNISLNMLPETPRMSGLTSATRIDTGKVTVQNTAREAGLDMGTFNAECDRHNWRDANTGEYTKEAALLALYSKRMQKSKIASIVSMILSMLNLGGQLGGDDDDKKNLYKVIQLMNEGYLSSVYDNFDAFELRINHIYGLLEKGAISQDILSDRGLITGLREHDSKQRLFGVLSEYLNTSSKDYKALNNYISMARAGYMKKLYEFRENYNIEPWLGLPMRARIGVSAHSIDRVKGGMQNLLRRMGRDYTPSSSADYKFNASVPILISVMFGKYMPTPIRAFFMSLYVMIGGGILPELSIIISRVNSRIMQSVYGMKAGFNAYRITKHIDSLMRDVKATPSNIYSARLLFSLIRPNAHPLSVKRHIDQHVAYRKMLETAGMNPRTKAVSITDDISPALEAINNEIGRGGYGLGDEIPGVQIPLSQIIYLINEGKIELTPRLTQHARALLSQVPLALADEKAKGLLGQTGRLKRIFYHLNPAKLKPSVLRSVFGYAGNLHDERTANAELSLYYDTLVPEQVKSVLSRAVRRDGYSKHAQLIREISGKASRFRSTKMQEQITGIQREIAEVVVSSLDMTSQQKAEMLMSQVLSDANKASIREAAKDSLVANGQASPIERQINAKVLAMIFSDENYKDYIESIKQITELNEQELTQIGTDVQEEVVSEFSGISIVKGASGQAMCEVKEGAMSEAIAMAELLNNVIGILYGRGHAGASLIALTRNNPELAHAIEQIKVFISDSTFKETRFNSGKGAIIRVRKTLGGPNEQRKIDDDNNPIIEIDQKFAEFLLTTSRTHKDASAWVMLERFLHELCHSNIGLPDHREDAVWQFVEEFWNKRNFDYPIMQALYEMGWLKNQVDDLFAEYGEMKEFSSAHFYRGAITRKQDGVRGVLSAGEVDRSLRDETASRMIDQTKQRDTGLGKSITLETLEFLLKDENIPDTITQFIADNKNLPLYEARQRLYALLSRTVRSAGIVQQAIDELHKNQQAKLVEDLKARIEQLQQQAKGVQEIAVQVDALTAQLNAGVSDPAEIAKIMKQIDDIEVQLAEAGMPQHTQAEEPVAPVATPEPIATDATTEHAVQPAPEAPKQSSAGMVDEALKVLGSEHAEYANRLRDMLAKNNIIVSDSPDMDITGRIIDGRIELPVRLIEAVAYLNERGLLLLESIINMNKGILEGQPKDTAIRNAAKSLGLSKKDYESIIGRLDILAKSIQKENQSITFEQRRHNADTVFNIAHKGIKVPASGTITGMINDITLVPINILTPAISILNALKPRMAALEITSTTETVFESNTAEPAYMVVNKARSAGVRIDPAYLPVTRGQSLVFESCTVTEALAQTLSDIIPEDIRGSIVVHVYGDKAQDAVEIFENHKINVTSTFEKTTTATVVYSNERPKNLEAEHTRFIQVEQLQDIADNMVTAAQVMLAIFNMPFKQFAESMKLSGINIGVSDSDMEALFASADMIDGIIRIKPVDTDTIRRLLDLVGQAA